MTCQKGENNCEWNNHCNRRSGRLRKKAHKWNCCAMHFRNGNASPFQIMNPKAAPSSRNICAVHLQKATHPSALTLPPLSMPLTDTSASSRIGKRPIVPEPPSYPHVTPHPMPFTKWQNCPRQNGQIIPTG